MTISELLTWGRQILEKSGSETASLDTSVLLSHFLGLSRAGLYARLEEIPGAETQEAFRSAVNRRAGGYPIAYITGYKEFMGLNFRVDERVLIPRPDTEILAEAALEKAGENPEGTSVLDLCTGSGCLGITISHFLPRIKVTLSDISERALEVAGLNAKGQTLGTVDLVLSDLFQNIPGNFDIIVTNPPYLLPEETKDCLAKGWEEPASALDGGGDDGLDLIRRLIPQAFGHLNPGGWLLLEAAPKQFPLLKDLFVAQGFTQIEIRQDLNSQDRIILGMKGNPK